MAELPPQIFGAIIGASVSLMAAIVVLIFTNKGHDKRQKYQHDHEKTLEDLKHRQNNKWTHTFSLSP
jgi:biopolymer transport protein ExbB/TolQ